MYVYWIGSRLPPDYDYDYEDAVSEDLLDTGAFVNRGLDSDNLLSDEEEFQRQHQLQQHQQLQQRQQQRAGKEIQIKWKGTTVQLSTNSVKVIGPLRLIWEKQCVECYCKLNNTCYSSMTYNL